MVSRTIIYIDTNIIRSEQSWEKDFSQLNPKGIFNKLLDLVEFENLKSNVDIGIPETVLLEFLKSKKENFYNELSTFKKKIPLFKNMAVFDLNNLKFPDENFNYQDYINQIIKDLNNNKNYIRLIKINWDYSKELLQSIYNKAIDNKPPFEKNKGKGKDKGFKDNLIWENIIQDAREKNYDNYFFLTENNNDFTQELEKEFSDRVNKIIKIIYSYGDLEKELDKIYSLKDIDIALKKHITNNYFISQVKELITSQLNIPEESISKLTLDTVNDFSSADKDGDLIQHQELFNLNEENILTVDDLENNYILIYTVKVSNKTYHFEVLFDFETKEIINTYYEEVENSNEL